MAVLKKNKKQHLLKNMFLDEAVDIQRYDEVKYPQFEKFVGDYIKFDWKDVPDEDVFQFPSKAAYDACDTSAAGGGKVISRPGMTNYKFLVTQPANSKLWFASSKPGSCEAGMKAELVVLAGGKCTQDVTDACQGLGRQPCTEATGACGACLDAGGLRWRCTPELLPAAGTTMLVAAARAAV